MSAASRRRGQASVLLIGEDTPGALMHSYATAFRRAGVVVETYCVLEAFRGSWPRIVVRAANRIAQRVMLARFNRRLLRDLRGRKYDLVLVLKGERIAPATIEKLREAGNAFWVNFYPDDPFSQVRSNRLAFGPATLRAYDLCLTFARHLIPRYQREGVERVEWLPFARDPDQHSPVANPGSPDFDAVFVGNLDAERVEWLAPIARELRLAVFGEHTLQAVPSGSPVRRATFFPAVYGKELAPALMRGAISLNVMREQNKYSHNMRSYESLACGAFTLSQKTPELEEMFRSDEEVAFADNPEAMLESARRWLADPSGRARVARAGFARVEHDTYEARAGEILRIIGLAEEKSA